jgi:hypothetical protein
MTSSIKSRHASSNSRVGDSRDDDDFLVLYDSNFNLVDEFVHDTMDKTITGVRGAPSGTTFLNVRELSHADCARWWCQ